MSTVVAGAHFRLWSALLEFEPRDLWLGVYWRRGQEGPYQTLHLWICMLPMVPLHLIFMWDSAQ